MKRQIAEKTFYTLPHQLKNTQEWFASIITAPLEKNDAIRPRTPNGLLIAEEAARYITPSPTLRPHQRMQIYNQQYWWRLLNTLHANFPFVTRLFGSLAFNEKIGIPYLLTYPPNHWSLNVLGERLPQWIGESYKERDRSLVLNAAELDWAFMASFIAPSFACPNLTELLKENAESILATPFYLQPSIRLFTWEYDLFAFRSAFLKQNMDYWIEHRFPKLAKGKTYFFILYRNCNNNLAWREISKGEYILLERFKNGTNISDACTFIESQDASVYEEVEKNLQKWLQEWIQIGWLTTHSSCTKDQ